MNHLISISFIKDMHRLKPLKRFCLVFLLSFCINSVSIAQIKDTAYDLMLKGIYKNTVPMLYSHELLEMKDYVLLDTRERQEYDVSHIDHAKWVGYESFDTAGVMQIPRDETIIVYCSVGYRSERIGERLLQLGFTKVYNLYGGIFEWVNNGNAVVDHEGKETPKVHAYSKSWGIWLDKGEKVY